MPFGAMASVVSDDPIQRSKLSRARSIGGTIVGIVGLSIVPVVCFDKQSNILPERFTLIAVIFGVLSIISYFVLLNFTQERIRQNSEKAEKFNYGKVLKATVHNRPLIGVMVATLGSMLFITGSNQVRSYIFKELLCKNRCNVYYQSCDNPDFGDLFPIGSEIGSKVWKKKQL